MAGNRIGFLYRGIGPKDPCTQIVYTLAPKYQCRDYFKAYVYTVWVHGSFGWVLSNQGYNFIIKVTILIITYNPT